MDQNPPINPPVNQPINRPIDDSKDAHSLQQEPHEVSFAPLDLSDLTVHFKEYSYHVHSVILSKESAYFTAAVQAVRISDSAPCSLTSACEQPGHRCLTLPNALGGADFTTKDMHEFLHHMYDGSLLLSSYLNFEGPPKYEIRLNSQTGLYGSLVVNDNQLDAVVTKLPISGGNSAPSCFSVRSGGSGMLGIDSFQKVHAANASAVCDRLLAFLKQHSDLVKLSHYFQCNSLLRYQELCCSMLLREAEGKGNFESLWQLLVLCETCHWKLLNDVINVVSKDKQFKSRSSWPKVAKSLTSPTLTRLLELMVH